MLKSCKILKLHLIDLTIYIFRIFIKFCIRWYITCHWGFVNRSWWKIPTKLKKYFWGNLWRNIKKYNSKLSIFPAGWRDKMTLKLCYRNTPIPPILLSWSLQMFWFVYGGKKSVQRNILIKLTELDPIFSCQLDNKKWKDLFGSQNVVYVLLSGTEKDQSLTRLS